MKLDEIKIIDAYSKGQSMNSIAQDFHTYTTTIKRILEKHDISLRHDSTKKGCLYVKDGEKLISWAKAQGRPVTKSELAKVLGKSRLSPSYFHKYPELGQYVASDERKEFHEYYEMLYKWLEDHHIHYKRNDKTVLGVSVDVLLLGEYANIALEIIERPKNVSNKMHQERLAKKAYKAHEVGLALVGLTKNNFEKDLEGLEGILKRFQKIGEIQMAKPSVPYTKDNEYYTPKYVVDYFYPDGFDYDPATCKGKAEELRSKTLRHH